LLPSESGLIAIIDRNNNNLEDIWNALNLTFEENLILGDYLDPESRFIVIEFDYASDLLSLIQTSNVCNDQLQDRLNLLDPNIPISTLLELQSRFIEQTVAGFDRKDYAEV